MNNQQIIDILTSWINITIIKQLPQEKDFWLLRDYAYEDMGERYYKSHAVEAGKILDGLDKKKEEVNLVINYLRPVVEKYV